MDTSSARKRTLAFFAVLAVACAVVTYTVLIPVPEPAAPPASTSVFDLPEPAISRSVAEQAERAEQVRKTP